MGACVNVRPRWFHPHSCFLGVVRAQTGTRRENMRSCRTYTQRDARKHTHPTHRHLYDQMVTSSTPGPPKGRPQRTRVTHTRGVPPRIPCAPHKRRNTSGVAQRNRTDMRIPQEPDKHTHQPRIYPVKVHESTHSPDVDDHRSVARTADVHEWRWSIGGAARVAAILGFLYKCIRHCGSTTARRSESRLARPWGWNCT